MKNKTDSKYNNLLKNKNVGRYECAGINYPTSNKIIGFSRRWKQWLPPVIACLCYINGLNGDFVHDDVYAIKRNNDVIGMTSFSDVFYNDFWGTPMASNLSHKSYRPLTVLTFRLTYWLHGPEPYFFHVVNVLLHTLVTWLLGYTCRHVLRLGETCALLAGLLFATHPIHTEAVSGIVGRGELLAAVFFLLSFIAYSRCMEADLDHQEMSTTPTLTTSVNLATSMLCGALAMISKESGVTVLGVCVLYDLVVHTQTRKDHRSDVSAVCRRIIVSVGFTIILLAGRLWIMDGQTPTFMPQDNPAAFQNNTLTRFLSRGFIWTTNIWLLLSPANLCYDWQHGSIPLVENISDHRNIATVALTTLFLFGAFTTGRQLFRSSKPEQDCYTTTAVSLCMSVIFLVLPFLPAANIFFTVGFVLAERVLYIPSMGWCMLISLGICHSAEVRPRYRRCIYFAFFIVLLLFSCKTLQQNQKWANRETLFRSGLQMMPHNAKVHFNYGNFLKDTGHKDVAAEHYRQAIRLDPQYACAHNNLGLELKDKSAAERHFRQAIRLQPSHQGALINLGTLLFNKDHHIEGMRYLHQAVQLNPRNPLALAGLAWCHMHTGNYTLAQGYLDTCIALHPDYTEAYKYYGLLMNKLERHREAARYYMRAYELQPDRIASLTDAAEAYQHMGDTNTAEHLLKQALTIQRDHSIMEKLAMLYYGAGRTRESLAVFGSLGAITAQTNPQTILKYTRLLEKEGQHSRVRSLLDEAVLYHGNNTRFLVSAALVHSRMARYNQSVVLLTRALTQVHEDQKDLLESIYYDRATNYKDLNNYVLALEDYKSVLKLNSNHTGAHGNIGAIYHTNAVLRTPLGDVHQARRHYEAVIRFDPSNDIVRENLLKLDILKKQLEHGIK